MRRAASAVPSQQITMPACCENPIPTPPPWCNETHVAPDAVFNNALSNGQSDTASEPSRMASVSRLGEATDPESRWSRPMTTGAFNSPLRDHLVERQPEPVSVPESHPADARRQSLERDAFARHVQPMVQMGVVRQQFLDLRVRAVDVLRVTGERHPAKRPHSTAKQRADVGGDEARKREGVLQPFVFGDLPDVVAVVERRHARVARKRASPRRVRAWKHARRARPSCGIAAAAFPAIRPSVHPLGRYPLVGSCAEVWSVTISGRTPRRTSSGKNFGGVAEQSDGFGVARRRPVGNHAPRPRRGNRPWRRGNGCAAGNRCWPDCIPPRDSRLRPSRRRAVAPRPCRRDRR